MVYSGPCLMHAQMWDSDFKKDFGIRCNVEWPCTRTCKEDFKQTCPKDWTLVDGLCEANFSSYTGPCVPFANMADFTPQDKQTFADLCEVTFPCEDVAAPSTSEKCKFLSDQTCPNGWAQIGSLVSHCYGPQYQGTCKPVISVSDLAAIGKQKFIDACNVEWPCELVEAATPTSLLQASWYIL